MKIKQIVTKAWKDPAFKKKLLTDPKATLEECGIKVPEHVNVKVIEDTANTYTLVIPQSPADIHTLSESELGQIAGGTETQCPCWNEDFLR